MTGHNSRRTQDELWLTRKQLNQQKKGGEQNVIPSARPVCRKSRGSGGKHSLCKSLKRKWSGAPGGTRTHDTVRAAMKLLGGMGSGKTTGRKKRVISAAARAKISKATKARWAKFRAAKAKGK